MEMEETSSREQELDVAREHGIVCAPKAIITLGFYLIWWAANKLVVTDRRVYIESGVLRKSERSVPLSNVQDVTVEQGLMGQIFGYGTIRIESAGGPETEIVMANIHDPGGIRDAIMAHVE
jgi:putative membrane protein